jgi:multidrug resistance efflux pump
VQQRAHPPRGALEASADGRVFWKKPSGSAVEAGERVGVLRIQAAVPAPTAIDPAAAARIKELEALAKQDPVYRDFLEKERRAAQRTRPGRATKELPLVAPASGILTLTVETRAVVERGATLASVVDDGAWVIDAFVDGAPPPPDAACELRGDAVDERVPCRLEGVRPRDGGSELTLTVPSADAAWVGGSRSLRVRVAPPGTPTDTPTDTPAEAPKQGAP